jgi:hypothetical protein
LALLDDVKAALRISAANTAYNTEVSDLIAAATADLKLSGVTAEKAVDTNTLIKRAITAYVKANFGWNNPDAERLQKSYEMLKNHLTLSTEYAFFTITFTVKDSVTAAAIQGAEVTFNGETKNTGAAGTAVFYALAGNGYTYKVAADDYISDDDEDNLVDVVAAAVGVAISLVAI